MRLVTKDQFKGDKILYKIGIVSFELLFSKKGFVIFICVRFLAKIPDWSYSIDQISKNEDYKNATRRNYEQEDGGFATNKLFFSIS